MAGRPTYDDKSLAAAVGSSTSWRGVLRALGLRATSSSAIRSVRLRADRLALDYTHFTGQRRWREGELVKAIAEARSWSEVTQTLGLSGGSSATALKGHAVRLGIDTEHLQVRRGAQAPPGSDGMVVDLHHLPRAGSLLAAAWFSLCGHDVSWPLEPCRYDLLVRTGAGFERIQVKTTTFRKADTWIVSISNTRKGRVVYLPDEIDQFFVIDGDLNYYLIPFAAVGGLHALWLSAYSAYRIKGAGGPTDAAH